MRYKAKVDSNQKEIVTVLRGVGASVQSLATIGNGVPDLLVGFKGKNYLFEVKDGSKPPSARKLTPDEIEWHQHWGGQVTTINNAEEALRELGFEFWQERNKEVFSRPKAQTINGVSIE